MTKPADIKEAEARGFRKGLERAAGYLDACGKQADRPAYEWAAAAIRALTDTGGGDAE